MKNIQQNNAKESKKRNLKSVPLERKSHAHSLTTKDKKFFLIKSHCCEKQLSTRRLKRLVKPLKTFTWFQTYLETDYNWSGDKYIRSEVAMQTINEISIIDLPHIA